MAFSMLGAGGACYCSDSPPLEAALASSDTQCSGRCSGNLAQACGGRGRLSVYGVRRARSTSSADLVAAIAMVPYDSCSGMVAPTGITLGGKASFADTAGGKEATIGFSGTMAGLQFFRYPLDDGEADCLFRNGEFTVGLCRDVMQMPSLHYFQSFLPAARDFSGARTNSGGKADAVEKCAEFCADKGFGYMALQWTSGCACDNTFGTAMRGDRVSNSQCDTDGDGAPDCGTGIAGKDFGLTRDPDEPTPCGWRNAVYRLTPNFAVERVSNVGYHQNIASVDAQYQGCFRDTGGKPDGLELYGDAFLDNAMSGNPTVRARMAATQEVGEIRGNGGYDDFGLHFDGEGDFATIRNEQEGNYATDGKFTISLWMTRPDCRAVGREEIIFSHTQDPAAPVLHGVGAGVEAGQPLGDQSYLANSDIAIAYGCAENGLLSSVPAPADGGRVHFIRVYMTDRSGHQFVFDFPLSDAETGGYVTSEWVFLALEVDGTSIQPYLDGTAVPPSDIGYPSDRAMSGDYLAMAAGEDAWAPGSLGEALDICAARCQQNGYAYMGLQWTDDCFCDNEYDSYGEADPDDCGEISSPDGKPLCGQGQASMDADGNGMCSERNAVYRVRGQTFQGCYKDRAMVRGAWRNSRDNMAFPNISSVAIDGAWHIRVQWTVLLTRCAIVLY
jgi:hypothetical protein